MHADKKIGRNFVRLIVENVLIICHGLPYESGSVVEKGYLDLAKFFASKNIPSVIFDFSGTGLSEGNFSLKLWVEDLVRISEEFERVSILGYGMGGAVAVRAASKIETLENIVLVASPCCVDMFSESILKMIYENASMKNLLRGVGDYETFKKSFMEEFLEIEPKNFIGKIKVPKLIIHGREDDIVPFENGLVLFELASKPKTFVELKTGNHFLRQNPIVSEIIVDWLKGKINKDKIIV